MCDPITATVIAATVVTAGSQVYGGLAANAQGKYEQKVAERNAQAERAQIADAKDRGALDQMRRYRQIGQRIGEQRVSFAGEGLELGFGSTFDSILDTTRVGAEDIRLIGENTTREIQGYDINAANFDAEGRAARARGKAAKTMGFLQAGATILGGAEQLGKYRASRSAGGSSNMTLADHVNSVPRRR